MVKADPGSSLSGAKGLCEALRRIFVTFGVAEEISTDGGMEFVSAEASDFYSRWGTTHRLSSAYFPQSNGRAEVAVKMTKRVLEDNVGANGMLSEPCCNKEIRRTKSASSAQPRSYLAEVSEMQCHSWTSLS